MDSHEVIPLKYICSYLLQTLWLICEKFRKLCIASLKEKFLNVWNSVEMGNSVHFSLVFPFVFIPLLIVTYIKFTVIDQLPPHLSPAPLLTQHLKGTVSWQIKCYGEYISDNLTAPSKLLTSRQLLIYHNFLRTW